MIDRGEQYASEETELRVTDSSDCLVRNDMCAARQPNSRNRITRIASQVSSEPLLRSSETSCKEAIQTLIGSDLEVVETIMREALSSRYSEVDQLCEHACSMGGKRLRPTLVLLSGLACSDGDLTKRQRIDLYRTSASVELVHAASLLHDDVMDDAETRRHMPTVGKLAGSNSAILLGDYLFTKAYDLAAQCRGSVPARQIAKAAASLCEGELRQQLMANHWSMTIPEYRSLLLEKTASLCAASCSLGARISLPPRTPAERELASNLWGFGKELGLAFQLYDDWLDFWGSDAMGKSAGNDLKQRKPTLPMLRYLQTASPAELSKMLGIVESSDSGQAEEQIFEAVRSELDRSDASEFTLRIARARIERALGFLRPVPASPYRDCLEQIAAFAAARIS